MAQGLDFIVKLFVTEQDNTKVFNPS